MNSFLEQNIKAFAKVDPLTAARLHSVIKNKRFEVFVDNDPANINIIDTERNKPVYATRPVDESLQKIQDFATQANYPYLYFFGLGNGIFYKMLLANTVHKRIVVIEPELEIMYIGLHFADFTKEIEDRRFSVVYVEDFNFVRASSYLRNRDSKIYSRLYDLNILLPFYADYQAEIVQINQIYIRAIEDAIISVGNDSKDALMGFEHHLKNLPFMLKTPTLIGMVKCAKNTETAVIVSTGPSLAKQLPLLKEIQEYVTILCIDASFPILCANGIKPDIVLSLERIPLTSEFYKAVPEEYFEGVIFELTSIVHEELLGSIKGGQIQMSMRPFGYTSYFGFEKWGYIGIGLSAANMAYEVAIYARFQNIIFIGQDLAYTEEGKTHSDGHIIDESKVEGQFLTSEVLIEKYGGGGVVKSTHVWRMFLNFFERDIADTPYDANVINATEGGARINGTKEIPFKEALASCVDQSKQKEPIQLEVPSQEDTDENIARAKTMVRGILTYSKEKKALIEQLFLDIAAELEAIEKLNKESKLEEIDFGKVLELVDRIDDIKDLFLEEKFVKLFVDAIQSYVISQELEIAKIQVKHTGDDPWLKKAKLLEWLYAHRQWLFWLAGGINAVMEIVMRGAQEWAEIDDLIEEIQGESDGKE